MRRSLLSLVLCISMVPLGAMAQSRDETLADIRQQLTMLNVEMQRLKRELSTTGPASGLSGGGGTIERVNAIESQLSRLTAKTEELEHRIDRVVTDGTNRIGDLEFRLVELEGGDVSQLGQATTLGGSATAGGSGPQQFGLESGQDMTVAPLPGAPSGDSAAADDPQLAVSEQADFDAARAQLDAGEYAAAATAFRDFQAAYPGSPLAPAAQLAIGRAQEGQGLIADAARSYLDGFSLDTEGQTAPVALLGLGRMLAQLGETQDACQTLAAIGERFPQSASAEPARTEMQSLACQ